MAGVRGPGEGVNYSGARWPALTDDERAMVEANTGLVAFVLRRRRTPTDRWDDAWQNGMLGLLRAAQMFEPAKGFRFSTYALTWIQACVQRGAEVEAGANARRAGKDGIEWAPLSLDLEFGPEGLLLRDIVAAGDDPAAAAVAAVHQVDVLERFTSLCRDDFDRALILGLADGRRPTAIARQHGQPESVARFRVARIRSRLRHPVYRHLTQEAVAS